MRFLVDAQLPPALSRWLTSRGHESEHVSDRNLQAAADSEIWEFAQSASAVIITKDEDFARRKALKVSGPTVVWIRVRNLRNPLILRAARFLGFSTLTRRGPRAKRADFEQGLPSYSAFRNPKSAGEDSSKENRQSDRQPSIAFLALGKMRGWLSSALGSQPDSLNIGRSRRFAGLRP